MNKYFSLLIQRKISEAETYRKSLIPQKLIKFVSLNDNINYNNKKFSSLEKQQLWFSSVQALNDPYEFRCMYINREELKEHGYDDYIIAKFQELLTSQIDKWSVASLSANTIDNLPMWAYYTNNYQGYCVEYDVIQPDAIFSVAYEPNRVALASIIANFYNEFGKMKERGEETNPEVEFYATILKYQLYSKHKSWKHENEYRIIFPLKTKIGQNVSIDRVGLKTNKIIVGLNCTSENKERLNNISNKLGCGNILEAKISGKNYTLFENK